MRRSERTNGRTKCILPAGLIAIACCVQAHADEKGDALLRQVHQRALALSPLAGEYTVTQHDPAGDKVGKCKAVIASGGIGQEGNAILPFGLFNLFDPLPQNAGAVTRYLGAQTIAGETFETVELRRLGLTLTLYVGSDGLIHRGHTMTGALRPPLPLSQIVDPKTGRPVKTPEEVALSRIAPPTPTDAHGIDMLVTEYRKPRQFPPRPALPPPLTTRRFQNLGPEKRRFPLRAALSSDGSRLMIAFGDETAQIVDTATGALQAAFPCKAGMSAPAFSPDSKLLAVCTGQQVMTLYAAATGHILYDLPSSMGMLCPVFSPDSRLLAVVDGGHTLMVWDTASGQKLLSMPQEGIRWAQFSLDSQFLTTMRLEGGKWLMRRGNIKTGLADPEREFPGGGWYDPIALSPDGKWLMIGGHDRSLVVYDAQTGAKVRDLPGSEGGADTAQFAADGKTLVASGWDTRGDMPTNRNGVTAWDTATWQVLGTGDMPYYIQAHLMSPVCIAPDGRTVAGLSVTGTVCIWAVPTK